MSTGRRAEATIEETRVEMSNIQHERNDNVRVAMLSKSQAGSINLGPWSEPPWSHGIPSPYYNESHRKLRDALRAYVNENILPYSLDWEAQGEAPRDAAFKWAQSGFCFADVPPEYRPKNIPPGPAGIPVQELDVFHVLVATDESSRVDGGVMSSLSGGSVIGIPPVSQSSNVD